MKKLPILKVSVSSLIGLGMALSVLAQSPSPTPVRTPLSREAIKQQMDDVREESWQKMEQARAALGSKLEAEREQLKTRLRTIKDERKRQAVERIDKNLNALNDKMTSHFMDVLDKLEDVLARIDERTDRAEKSGIDVSLVRTASEAAYQAIKDARTAIVAQAGKTYKIAVTTENDLRGDVGKVRQALHADLSVIRDSLAKARNAVYETARAFAKAHGRDLPDPSASPSPTL